MNGVGRGGPRPDPSPGFRPRSSSNNRGPWIAPQCLAMERRYRFTRHVYDLVRGYASLGCDELLDRIVTSPSTATLEVGCGTGRNLLRLADRPEPGRLYGLDASHAMLTTAERSLRRRGGPGRTGIVLRQGLAEELDGRRMFGRGERFDTIFFSYCLSMVPAWEEALMAALANLEPGGVLLILDRSDASGPAGAIQRTLLDLGRSGRAAVRIEPVGRRRGFLATVRTGR